MAKLKTAGNIQGMQPPKMPSATGPMPQASTGDTADPSGTPTTSMPAPSLNPGNPQMPMMPAPVPPPMPEVRPARRAPFAAQSPGGLLRGMDMQAWLARMLGGR